MGVAGLASFLKRQYPAAYRQLSEEEASIDHLYIDLASTLHQIVRKARTRTYFHHLLHKRLDAILAACKPRKRVVIALDGPAPLAKLLEQRRRRRREADRASRRIVPSGRYGRPSAAAALPGLSALMLTTGTPLMLEVHQSLQYWICRRLAEPGSDHLQFELSDSTVKGEGELKILARLLEEQLNEEGEAALGAGGGLGAGGSGSEPESHMILGCDSDLLLMAMVSGRRRLYIADDSQDFEELFASPAAPEDSLDQPSSGGSFSSSLDQESQDGWSLDSVEGSMDGVGVTLSPEEPPSAARAAPPSTPSSSGGGDPSGGGGGGGMRVFCRDALERLWVQRHLGGGSKGGSGGGGLAASAAEQTAMVTGMALDLTLLAIICGGNDYLPGMQGLQMVCKHRPGLWQLYLEMQKEPEWHDRRLVRRQGQRHGSVRIDAAMLSELLQRYNDRRAQAVLLAEDSSSSDEDEEQSVRSSSGFEDESSSDGEEALGSLSVEEAESAVARRRVASARRALNELNPALLRPPRLHTDTADAERVLARLTEAAEAAAAAAAEAEAAAAASSTEEGAAERGGRARTSSGGGTAGLRSPCHCDDACSPRMRKQHSARTDADAEEYLRGLEWVLHMYTRGSVEDYRWTYDMSAPSLPELMEALQSGAGEAAGGRAAADAADVAGPVASMELELLGEEERAGAGADAAAALRGRGSGPLLPAACALALLPGRGRAHAPTALQTLMDPGSPLADIYAVCPDCSAIGKHLSTISRDLHRMRLELAQLRRVYDRVWLAVGGSAAAEYPAPAFASPAEVAAELQLLAPGEGGSAPLQLEAARLQVAVHAREQAEAQLKATMAALSRVQKFHVTAEHPYKPFPTADLEAAVAAVPVEEHPWRERRLLRFGRDLLYRRQHQRQQQQEEQEGAEQLAAAAASPALSAAEQQGPEAFEPLPGLEPEEGTPSAEASTAAAAAAAGGEGPAVQRPRPYSPYSRPASVDTAADQQLLQRKVWLKECAAFAAAYHRVMDQAALMGPGAQGILREALPISRTLRQQLRAGGGGSSGGGARARGKVAGGPSGVGGLPKGPAALAGPAASGGSPASTFLGAQVRQYHWAGSAGVPPVGGAQQLLRQCGRLSRLLPQARVRQLLFTCLRRF